ncbi:hypothetical protein EK21DRAFT_88597 [Setomelanomma holmii]|uniref:Uncharacterized protein n=1 Tax=Setomelanomma holmii TaxID=210430 RepID=A0A9P4HAG9_9PLEO|nr:hypothetical protein EK21DRAFT_88597 [Setomelanomma holmii]
MTLNTEAKSKRRTKHRPVERPDGVIVLQRPYQPTASSSSPQQPPKFEAHVPTFVVPTKIKCPTRKKNAQRVGENLTSIGAQFEQGRDGYNDVVDCGRGGYNDVQNNRQDLSAFLKEILMSHGLPPMQRFLSEAGPRGAFEMHDI